MNSTVTAKRISRSLHTVAAVTALAVLALWVATGAHRGWTRTSKVTYQHDEITGIDYPVHEKTFVAGVEVLAVGAGLAAAFAGAGAFVSRRHRSAVSA